MKRATAEINVSVRDGSPFLINWCGRTYVVKRIADRRQERKLLSRREIFRLETDKEELEISTNGKDWRLERVLEPDAVAAAPALGADLGPMQNGQTVDGVPATP
ncbi:MAG TPA: hypothetical protein VFG50_08250 [Rhodothermales bacterium]|nr:hypothetical protein [Rhodothermales bacterium]